VLTHSISDEIEQKIFGKWRRHFPIEQNEPEILPRPRFPTLHLLTLFREQGVTIASVLTALGFIVSTIVLAIQNTLGRGWPTPAPTPSDHDGVTDWVKKQLKTLASWLKTLAEKAAAALPGIIGAIVSWLLKTAGSVAVWLAEHLWALAIALVAAAAVYMRDYRAPK